MDDKIIWKCPRCEGKNRVTTKHGEVKPVVTSVLYGSADNDDYKCGHCGGMVHLNYNN